MSAINELYEYLNKRNLSIEDMAGCEYCSYYLDSSRDCFEIECAIYHGKQPFYYEWRVWIRDMMKLNDLGYDFIKKFLKVDWKDARRITSGHVNPEDYKNKNYAEKLLKYFGATKDDVHEHNVFKKKNKNPISKLIKKVKN